MAMGSTVDLARTCVSPAIHSGPSLVVSMVTRADLLVSMASVVKIGICVSCSGEGEAFRLGHGVCRKRTPVYRKDSLYNRGKPTLGCIVGALGGDGGGRGGSVLAL